MGGVSELETTFAMVSTQAAALMGLTEWELAVGTPATLVVLPVTTAADAVISMARPAHQLVDGTLI
jgi:cytosine/adenosine deaminase-related metal-dependent hydrolase